MDNWGIDEFIDRHIDDMTEFLKELVRIPSIKADEDGDMPYGREVFRALKFTEGAAANMGFETESFENRICKVTYGGKDKRLGILCHLDVVEVNAEKWETPPFEPVIKDGMIYGRGVLDNKGPGVAALYALYAVKQLEIPLKHGVGLYFGTDEEKGMSDFAEYLKKHSLPKNIFVPDACFPVGVTEKGAVQLLGAAEAVSDKILSVMTDNDINIIPDRATAKLKAVSDCEIDSVLGDVNDIKYDIKTENGITTVTVYGKSAHSAGPQNGINAATALLLLLAQIGGRDSIFEKIAKRFKHGTFFGEGFGFTTQQTTLSLTGLNFDDNTLEIKTDSKISYTESAERITEKIIAEMPLEMSVICIKEPHAVSRDLEIVQTLQKIYKEQTGRNDEPYDMDAGTYARIAKDAVIFGGVLYGDGGCNAHSENECYSLETLAAAAKMFAKAIVEICG